MKPRAGVLVVDDGRIALIERRRGSLHYWVFPGGGVDRGEDFETAARREAHEELGVEVELIGSAVRMRTPSEHRYWRARPVGGTFGAGHGHEHTRAGPWSGSYRAVWVEVDRLEQLRIIPRSLARFVARAEREGWPETDVTLIEWAWLEHGPQQRSFDPFVAETLDVVPATPEDIPGWLDLAREVEDLFGAPMASDPGFRAALEKNIQRGTAFCVRECWGPPGTPLAGGMLWSPARNAIGWLSVAERYRRRGIGSALIEHLIDVARAPVITVETFADDVIGGEPARVFYERHGFRVSPGSGAPGRIILQRSL